MEYGGYMTLLFLGRSNRMNRMNEMDSLFKVECVYH